MKKNIIITAITAASAILLAASCQKQDVPELKIEGKTFTAVINQELTKTTITSGYKVNWGEGDQIDINGGTTYSATPNTSDATRASFTKVGGSDPTPDYTAVYPASLFKNSGYELPATQTYAAGKFNAPMCAISSTESLEFKNFCGVLCFALKGTDKVRSIAVTANKQLCGPFEFTDATAISFTGENEGYTVTLDCGEGVQLNASTATNFYIYLPPATYTTGMKMTITNTAGKTFEKTTTKTAEISRSNIYTFNWTPSFGSVIPEGALPGEFTVNISGKKVYFSKGNLYYDGSKFKFEDNQYNVQASWSISHVSLFYWSQDKSVACANSYSDGSAADTDVFFTNADGFKVNVGDADQSGWRTLSNGEWQYLLNNHSKKWASVNGLNGYVIAPDGFDGTLADSYTDDAALAADNLVFLPAAGWRLSKVYDVGGYGYYWSSSAPSGYEKRAYSVRFDSDLFYISCFVDRCGGYSVRLITECQ